MLINTVSVYYMARTIEPVLTLMALGPVPIVVIVTILLQEDNPKPI